MRRHVAWSLLALVLVSCGGEPPPAAPPVPAAPTSTTPTPVAAPTMPTAATKNTGTGAVEFVKYYVELINHAQATGDTRALSEVDSPHCAACNRFKMRVSQLYDSGGTIVGGNWHLHHAVAIRLAPAEWLVSAPYTFDAQTIRMPNKRPTPSPRGNDRLNVTLHNNGSWTVIRLALT